MKARQSVLVIRDEEIFSQTLRSADLEVTTLPLIRTEPLDDQSSLRRSLDRLNEYDGLFFTSPVAADIFQKERSNGPKYLGKIYAMGARSKEVFDLGSTIAEYDPSISSAEHLIQYYSEDLYGKRFLFVRGDRSMQTIPKLLDGKSIVDEVVVYRTVDVRLPESETISLREMLDAGEFDWTCFFSPSGVDAFLDTFGTPELTKVAAIGRTTALRAAENGFDVEFISPRPSAVDFAEAFVSYLNGKQS